MKFETVYNEYLKYAEYYYKQQTYNSLKERFNSKILPYFKDYNIYKINEFDYLNWQIEIKKFNYSNSYNSNLHYLMVGFFNYLIKFYGIKKNIPKLIGNFKMKNEIKIYNTYNYKEFKKFIKGFDNIIYKNFFLFLYFTGVRPGEAMALKFSDLTKSYISINKTMNEHGKREITTPKTKNSIRIIKLDNKLYKDLLKLKKYYKNDNNDLYIFGGIKPISPTTINRYKLKACEKTNVKPIKLHEFRHSHATLLINNKIIINEISRRLGHSNPSITMDIYCHTNLDNEKKVIKTLNFMRLFK